MQFFSKEEIESKPFTWNTHSQTPHSATSIAYLGRNDDGWTILQLYPRFPNDDGTMAKALQSVCIDMANPDEDSDTQPKSAKLCNKDGDGSTIVEAEDLPAFLNHLTYCKCITAMDAKLILEAIMKNQQQTKHVKYQTSSSTTVHKENADAQSNFEPKI